MRLVPAMPTLVIRPREECGAPAKLDELERQVIDECVIRRLERPLQELLRLFGAAGSAKAASANGEEPRPGLRVRARLRVACQHFVDVGDCLGDLATGQEDAGAARQHRA